MCSDVPSFGSYDRSCENVGQQGECQGGHLRDVDDAGEVTMDRDSLWGKEQAGSRHDRHQEKDWKRVERRTAGEVKRIKEEGRSKRTRVDRKDSNRKHQDDLTLARTQDPSPPDNDAVGEDIL